MIRWREGLTLQVWRDDKGEVISSGTFTGGPHKIVLHSTETGTWPGYSGGQSAPHETWKWNASTKKFDKRQHIPHDVGARALKNGPDPAQTNRDSAHQIELIGSCDETFATRYGYDYLPGLGDDFLLELGREVRRLAADTGVDLEVTPVWRHYPESYGENAPQRFSIAEWDAFSGVCGHQHVPDSNSHGDPGDIDVPRAIALSAQEDDMQDADFARIAKETTAAVLGTLFGTADKNLKQRLSEIGLDVDAIRSHTTPLAARVDALEAKVDQVLAAISTGGTDPDVIRAACDQAIRTVFHDASTSDSA